MDLQRAKELLSGLTDGVDPLTGEVLPEDHVCNKAEIIRAFHCVLKALPGKASKPQPENAGKPWSDADDAVLCQMFDAGGSRKEMCAYFKRSEGSLAARLVRLGKISDRAEFRNKKRRAIQAEGIAHKQANGNQKSFGHLKSAKTIARQAPHLKRVWKRQIRQNAEAVWQNGRSESRTKQRQEPLPERRYALMY